MKHHQFTATSLRMTLSISLLALPLLAGGLFYFVNRQLTTVAIDVSHTIVDASASQTAVQSLQAIQRELENDKDVIARANSIVADSQSYQYQDQIVGDLNRYAASAHIEITNIDFSTTATTTPTSGGTTSDRTGASSLTSPTTPLGVKSITVAVSMKNPIGYEDFLQFIRSIEDNLTKMQIQKVSLSKGTSDNDITSDALTIQAYIR